jgi:hypothetical protein
MGCCNSVEEYQEYKDAKAEIKSLTRELDEERRDRESETLQWRAYQQGVNLNAVNPSAFVPTHRRVN